VHPSESASVAYDQVEVNGDTTVVVGDSETVTLALDGIPYDVYVTSRKVNPGGPLPCMDYYPAQGTALDIRARDLASRVSELSTGTPVLGTPTAAPAARSR
jgi:hypothetical protein